MKKLQFQMYGSTDSVTLVAVADRDPDAPVIYNTTGMLRLLNNELLERRCSVKEAEKLLLSYIEEAGIPEKDYSISGPLDIPHTVWIPETGFAHL